MKWLFALAALSATGCTATSDVQNTAAPPLVDDRVFGRPPIPILELPPLPGAEPFVGLSRDELAAKLGMPNETLGNEFSYFMDYVSSFCMLSFGFDMQTSRVRWVIPSTPDQKKLLVGPITPCLSSILRERGLAPE